MNANVEKLQTQLDNYSKQLKKAIDNRQFDRIARLSKQVLDLQVQLSVQTHSLISNKQFKPIRIKPKLTINKNWNQNFQLPSSQAMSLEQALNQIKEKENDKISRSRNR